MLVKLNERGARAYMASGGARYRRRAIWRAAPPVELQATVVTVRTPIWLNWQVGRSKARRADRIRYVGGL